MILDNWTNWPLCCTCRYDRGPAHPQPYWHNHVHPAADPNESDPRCNDPYCPPAVTYCCVPGSQAGQCPARLAAADHQHSGRRKVDRWNHSCVSAKRRGEWWIHQTIHEKDVTKLHMYVASCTCPDFNFCIKILWLFSNIPLPTTLNTNYSTSSY